MKTPKIKKPAIKKLLTKKAVNHQPARQIASVISQAPMEYVLPGGIALGACLLAATGIMFRKPLKAVARLAVRGAMHEGATAMKILESGRLLEAVGVRRRRPSIAVIAGAGLGALGAIGAGAALTLWLAPNRTIPSLAKRNGAIPKSMSDSVESATAGSAP
jgi:hypothetical protein